MNNETTPSVQTPAGIAVQGLAGFVMKFAIVAALELALTELAWGSISGLYCPCRRLPFNKFATKACATDIGEDQLPIHNKSIRSSIPIEGAAASKNPRQREVGFLPGEGEEQTKFF
jgi:hypothetical protein